MDKKSKKGFTLIEVIIVVVIIALLTTMAIPAFNKIKQTAKTKAILNNLKIIAAAGSQYMLENNTNSVDYNSLVGTYFTPITPVAGENYTDITVLEAGVNNTLSTTTSNGTTVTLTY